jgi:hypothetical protein
LHNTIYADRKTPNIKQLFGEFSSHIIHLEDRQSNYAASEGSFQLLPFKNKKIQSNIIKNNQKVYQAYSKEAVN